jgi:hypothetical protein
MKDRALAIPLGLSALALWACAAAQAATPAITDLALVPELTITSDWGTTNEIQYCTNLSQGAWLPLTGLVMGDQAYLFQSSAETMGRFWLREFA